MEIPSSGFSEYYHYSPCPVPLPEWFNAERSDDIIYVGMRFTTELKIWAGLLAWIIDDMERNLDDDVARSFINPTLDAMAWITGVGIRIHNDLLDYISDKPHLNQDPLFHEQIRREEEAHNFIAEIQAITGG